MDTQPNYFATAIQYWPAAVIFIIATASIIGLLLIIKLAFNRHHLLHRDMVWLEITPPSNVAKTPQATEQLFSVLHGMHAARSLREKLLGYSPTMSFEITSTRKDGIRYIIQVEKKYSKTVQKAITSYIP